ncbi:hypothetical protein MAM1_0272c09050 [Mucor ambiguus]|uniref:Protein kinase domain-containing protein n=1 Tax=Mucor ambiguus TaxID=91626 RepID=A0A0C9LX22_9FUNG|nr:hypothetical protein MAM1_0272c09050 [Mucor ambiguus]
MSASKQQAKGGTASVALQLGAKKMNLSPDQFRQCVFIIDELVSTYDCHQFMTPVPPTAVIYHSQIKHPMDLKTLEQNLFSNKYKNVKDFAKDLFLIWENAMRFHLSVDPIYQQALTLKKRYDEIILFIRGGKRPLYLSTEIQDVTTIGRTLIPEELYNNNNKIEKQSNATEKSTLYGIHIFSNQDHNTKRMYGGTNQHVFQMLNSYFFEYMSKNQAIRKKMPLPRLYIAKNRTLLKQAHSDPSGALAILYDIKMTPVNVKGESMLKIRATVLLAEPVNQVHDMDDSTMDFSESISYSPKAWIKVRPLQSPVHHVESIITKDIDRNCLKKVFTTFKISTKYNTDPKKIRNFEVAKQFAQSMLYPVSSPDTSGPASEIDAQPVEKLTSTPAAAAPHTSPSSSSSPTTKSSTPTATGSSRKKETSQTPKLRSRVASNADLDSPLTTTPKSRERTVDAESGQKPKIKLIVLADRASTSSPSHNASLKPEEPLSNTSSTTPTVSPVKKQASKSRSTEVSLKLPHQSSSKKHKSSHDTSHEPAPPTQTASTTTTRKRLTINPPKGTSQIQTKCTASNAPNPSPSSPASPTLKALKKRPHSPSLADSNTTILSKHSKSPKNKERKLSLSKKASVKNDTCSPASATTVSMTTLNAASSSFTPTAIPPHQLPANVIYGYPPPHLGGYIYSHPPAIYQLAPNGYPQPHPYPEPVYYYPQPSNTTTPSPPLPPPQASLHNGHVAYHLPSPVFIPQIPMQLPPLRLELPPVPTSPLLGSPVSPAQHQPEIPLSQARENHYSPPLVNQVYTPTVVQPPRQTNRVDIKQEKEVEGSCLNDAPTPDYEYSDPGDESEEEENAKQASSSEGSPSEQEEEDSDDDMMGSPISSLHSGDTDSHSPSVDDQNEHDLRSHSQLPDTADEHSSVSDSNATTEPREAISSSHYSVSSEVQQQPAVAAIAAADTTHSTTATKRFTCYVDQFEYQTPSKADRQIAADVWHKISSFASQKQIPMVDIHHYDDDDLILIPAALHHHHHHCELKSVFWIPSNNTKVIQLFQRMTIHQRVSEVVGLMQLARLPHMPQVHELLHDGSGEIIGVCMQRFEMTLKEYIQHRIITAEQKLDMVLQMIESVLILHEIGIAHCDLSSWNFMVNRTHETLKDGSEKVDVWLTQFNSAVFIHASDYREWWVQCPSKINADYMAQVVPKDEHALDMWCKALPWIQSKPVHRNFWYCPIETLPKHASDHDILPHPVNPIAQDLYTLGMIIWEIISDGTPWKSLEKNDLHALRQVIQQDESLERVLRHEMPGSVSIELLLKLLQVQTDKRCSAKALLSWISAPSIETALMNEWTITYKRPLEELAVNGDSGSLYKKLKL